MKLTPSERKQIREESEIYRFDFSDFSAASAAHKWQGRVAALLDELEEVTAKYRWVQHIWGSPDTPTDEEWKSYKEEVKDRFRLQARRELYGEE